jgi:hypothetical protein
LSSKGSERLTAKSTNQVLSKAENGKAMYCYITDRIFKEIKCSNIYLLTTSFKKQRKREREKNILMENLREVILLNINNTDPCSMLEEKQ